jgi:hypothetical protein
MKGLIKEGKDVASVKVILRNKGADAYRRINNGINYR